MAFGCILNTRETVATVLAVCLAILDRHGSVVDSLNSVQCADSSSGVVITTQILLGWRDTERSALYWKTGSERGGVLGARDGRLGYIRSAVHGIRRSSFGALCHFDATRKLRNHALDSLTNLWWTFGTVGDISIGVHRLENRAVCNYTESSRISGQAVFHSLGLNIWLPTVLEIAVETITSRKCYQYIDPDPVHILIGMIRTQSDRPERTRIAHRAQGGLHQLCKVFQGTNAESGSGGSEDKYHCRSETGMRPEQPLGLTDAGLKSLYHKTYMAVIRNIKIFSIPTALEMDLCSESVAALGTEHIWLLGDGILVQASKAHAVCHWTTGVCSISPSISCVVVATERLIAG